jgi:CheY-like chemotaxis protein
MNCEPEPKQASNLLESKEGTRVLLVEDAPFVRIAFGRLLRRLGFDVCEATDGVDALQRVAEFRPEIVLTDLMMPSMDGFELTRRLLSQPETSKVAVVAITADATEQTERKAREAGPRRDHQADQPGRGDRSALCPPSREPSAQHRGNRLKPDDADNAGWRSGASEPTYDRLRSSWWAPVRFGLGVSGGWSRVD